jgi:hypothetical protein
VKVPNSTLSTLEERFISICDPNQVINITTYSRSQHEANIQTLTQTQDVYRCPELLEKAKNFEALGGSVVFVPKEIGTYIQKRKKK